MTGRVVHFEIQADDTERAVAFYSGVFGWGITKVAGTEDVWAVTPSAEHAATIGGTIKPRRHGVPGGEHGANAYVCLIEVDDIDRAAVAVEQHGGQPIGVKSPVTDTGWLLYVKDPDGNVLGLFDHTSFVG